MIRYFGLAGKSVSTPAHPLAPRSLERTFRRGESYVGFAWGSARDGPHVAVRIPNTGLVPAESVAFSCELREANNTLTAGRIKHGEGRL
jgi:hypothetical protein